MGINVNFSESGMTASRQAADSKNLPALFAIQHLNGRVATSVRFDPVPSKFG
jgi:hypothetical protein